MLLKHSRSLPWLSIVYAVPNISVFTWFSLKEALLMPFTTISSQIHCQGLLPLYPVTSSDTLSSASTSISFYKVHIHFSFFYSCTHLCINSMILFFIIFTHDYFKKQDEDSQHEASSYNLTDYVCFKIPDGSLNKRNCIGVIKDSGNCCTALSMASLSGCVLHMPDEYECVDLSLYKVLHVCVQMIFYTTWQLA